MVERLEDHPIRRRVGKAIGLMAVGGAVGAAVEGSIALATGDTTTVFIAGFIVGPASAFALVIEEVFVGDLQLPHQKAKAT